MIVDMLPGRSWRCPLRAPEVGQRAAETHSKSHEMELVPLRASYWVCFVSIPRTDLGLMDKV